MSKWFRFFVLLRFHTDIKVSTEYHRTDRLKLIHIVAEKTIEPFEIFELFFWAGISALTHLRAINLNNLIVYLAKFKLKMIRRFTSRMHFFSGCIIINESRKLNVNLEWIINIFFLLYDFVLCGWPWNVRNT